MQLFSYSAYALWIVRVLADSDKPMTKVKLGQRLGIDFGFVQQVARRLQGARLVRGVRGPYGGYTLAKDATKISQLAVIEAAWGSPVFGAQKKDPPLLAEARQMIRERLLPVLDISILEWPLPPKP
jgi:Rrf2 family protein